MVGTKAQSELIPLVEQNSITKNSCNEQFYLFDFSGESNVNRFAAAHPHLEKTFTGLVNSADRAEKG